MQIRPRSLPILAVLALAIVTGAASGALADGDHDGDHDGDRDHDRARAALRAGRILPLEEILARANAAFPGEILDVEFEDEHGRVVYEIKTVTADGRILKLEYDAATGTLLEAKGKHRDRKRR